MCVRFVSAALTVVALAAAPVLLSASDNPVPGKDGKAVQSTTVEKTSTIPSATLKGVKAVPMAAKELDAVKGLHLHFWNPGAPFPGPPHLVVKNHEVDEKNYVDIGTGQLVAPGYRGLCKAAANNSAIFINPGGGC